jgi:hypothetical protein
MREDEGKQQWVAEAVIRPDSGPIESARAKTVNKALTLLSSAVSSHSTEVQKLEEFRSSLPGAETAD